MKVWMKVSKDKYRLPEVIADSSVELAAICGTTENAVRSSACHARKSEVNYRYIAVEVDE